MNSKAHSLKRSIKLIESSKKKKKKDDEETQITNIRTERGNFTLATTDIKRIMRKYYE